MSEATNIITVSELNAKAKQLLEGNFNVFWIQGEVSGVTQSSLGHYYFILKDDKAQVSCALFKYQAKKIACELKEGVEVELTGKVTLYEARGNYQIIVEDIKARGLGKLYSQYVQSKEKLEKLGYFDSTIKKTIPFFPNKVGLVTSSSGAVIRDIVVTLKRRMSQIGIVLYPTLVQGKGSEFQIAEAIDLANQRNEVDVLIVARGGGGLEDLWSFNEEIVVEAIYRSTIPVVSGIGHETDITLSDFAADLRAPTPTGAAELVSPNREDLHKGLMAHLTHINSLLSNRYHESCQYLDSLNRSLVHPHQKVKTAQQALQYREIFLKKTLSDKLKQQKSCLQEYILLLRNHQVRFRQMSHQLVKIRSILSYELRIALQMKQNALAHLKQQLPKPSTDEYRKKLSLFSNQLDLSCQQVIHISRYQLDTLSQLLKVVSPIKILERGYSMVTDVNGKVVSSHRQLVAGQKLSIHFKDGKSNVVVED